MEAYSFVLLSLVAVFLLWVWYRYAYGPYQLFKRLGVPCPPAIPFLGHSWTLKKLDFNKTYEMWIPKYGKVVGYYVGSKPVMVIADPDMIKEITVKQFDNFVERSGDSALTYEFRAKYKTLPTLFFMKKQEWKRVRPIVSPSFSSKKIRMMMPLVERSCVNIDKKMVDLCAQKDTVNIWRVFGEFTMETILSTAFGCQINVLKGEGNALTEAVVGFLNSVHTPFLLACDIISSQFPFLVPLIGTLAVHLPFSLKKTYGALKDSAYQLVEARLKRLGTENIVDLLQLLVDARTEAEEKSDLPIKKLTHHEVVTTCIGFLMAGYETTSNLLAYTTQLLILNPHVQDKLCEIIKEYYKENPDISLCDASQNIPYLEWVLQESLRFYPPVSRAGRICQNSCTVNGVNIPGGCDIEFPILYLHHSPDHWDRPELFRPERFSPEESEGRHPLCYLPFGWGPRNCLGLRFAMLEAKMCLLTVLKKYKFERTPETQVPLKTRFGFTESPVDGVFVKVVPVN